VNVILYKPPWFEGEVQEIFLAHDLVLQFLDLTIEGSQSVSAPSLFDDYRYQGKNFQVLLPEPAGSG
jgi:hypothetical protein